MEDEHEDFLPPEDFEDEGDELDDGPEDKDKDEQ